MDQLNEVGVSEIFNQIVINATKDLPINFATIRLDNIVYRYTDQAFEIGDAPFIKSNLDEVIRVNNFYEDDDDHGSKGIILMRMSLTKKNTLDILFHFSQNISNGTWFAMMSQASH